MVDGPAKSSGNGASLSASAPMIDDSSTAAVRVGRRLHPAQRMLLFASAGVIVGSFLPWVTVNMGATFGGFAGAGLYTFYVGVLGLAGGLVPMRWPAIVQGAVMAAVAIALPVWQVVRLLSKVGVSGWVPGTGLIVVFVSGLLAALATFRIWSDEPSA